VTPTVESVIRENADFVFRSLRHLGVRESDLPDQCQEVFLVVGRRLGDWEGRSSLRTWVYGICRGIVLNYRRSRRRRPEHLVGEVPEEVATDTPLDAFERHQQKERLLRALDALEIEPREVFVLYEIEHLSIASIAEMTQSPAKTVYSRLYAARRAILGQFEGEENL
jgi:RNA polymerase sigma-70 factor (ECF subfamily)